MTNTGSASRAPLSRDLDFEVTSALLSFRTRSAIPVGSCGASSPVLAEMARLGWLEVTDYGPGAGRCVDLTGLGSEAASEAFVAAVGAAHEWSLRLPL